MRQRVCLCRSQRARLSSLLVTVLSAYNTGWWRVSRSAFRAPVCAAALSSFDSQCLEIIRGRGEEKVGSPATGVATATANQRPKKIFPVPFFSSSFLLLLLDFFSSSSAFLSFISRSFLPGPSPRVSPHRRASRRGGAPGLYASGCNRGAAERKGWVSAHPQGDNVCNDTSKHTDGRAKCKPLNCRGLRVPQPPPPPPRPRGVGRRWGWLATPHSLASP